MGRPRTGLPVSGTVKRAMLLILKIPDNAVGGSGVTVRRRQGGAGMTMRDSAYAPAGGRSAARAATGLGRLEKRPPQEQGGDIRLARSSIEPPARLQAQRPRLTDNDGKRPRMKGLLHDAQNLGILPAFDPDDTRRLQAEAGEAGRIAIGAAQSPERTSFLDAQNSGGCRRHKRRHRRRKLGFESIRQELVKRAKLKAAVRERRVQPAILERQDLIALACLHVAPLKGEDLHP